jgi:A/G-specific adenine glycosylase
VQQALPDWYRRHRRDLPWRRRRDAYAIWVSEIMLQQTRVATVVPYFQRWMRRFPDVAALAAAPLERVLKAWEGLGYYSRARNLHRAARKLVADFGGALPADTRRLRALPGIGRYTAGAIASIAFGLDEPVLDGNVTRVLCRVFRIRRRPTEAGVRRRLWSLARRLIPTGQAGLFNQALMDLGATLCTPRSPRCLICPLRDVCLACVHGEQAQLPRRAARKQVPHHDVLAALLQERGRVLLARRPTEGLLGGLWELPGGRLETGRMSPAALRRIGRAAVGIELIVGPLLGRFDHAFTHFRMTLHVFACRRDGGRARPIGYAACKWLRRAELDAVPLATLHRRALRALGVRPATRDEC